MLHRKYIALKWKRRTDDKTECIEDRISRLEEEEGESGGEQEELGRRGENRSQAADELDYYRR